MNGVEYCNFTQPSLTRLRWVWRDGSDFSERSLVLLPYALSNRRDSPPQGQGSRRLSGPGLNLSHLPDTADNRAWFCWAYQRGECSRPDPHWAFVPGRGPVTVKHICAKCYLTEKKKLPHPENKQSCPCPSAGTTWQIPQQSPSAHSGFTSEPVTLNTVPKKDSADCRVIVDLSFQNTTPENRSTWGSARTGTWVIQSICVTLLLTT